MDRDEEISPRSIGEDGSLFETREHIGTAGHDHACPTSGEVLTDLFGDIKNEGFLGIGRRSSGPGAGVFSAVTGIEHDGSTDWSADTRGGRRLRTGGRSGPDRVRTHKGTRQIGDDRLLGRRASSQSNESRERKRCGDKASETEHHARSLVCRRRSSTHRRRESHKCGRGEETFARKTENSLAMGGRVQYPFLEGKTTGHRRTGASMRNNLNEGFKSRWTGDRFNPS